MEERLFRGSERDWMPQYAAIGEFIVAFEGCCFWLRNGAGAVLQTRGLNPYSLADIILNIRPMTAEPLFELYASLAAEATKGNAHVLKSFSEIRNSFKELAKLRNDVVHASYLMGPDVNEMTSAPEPRSFFAEKRTPDSKGARVMDVATTLDEMKAHAQAAWEMKRRLIALFGDVMKGLHAPAA